MGKIKVIKIPVDSDPFVVEVDTTLEAMQAAIGGGYIEIVPINQQGLELLCDEEGKIKGLTPNVLIFGGLDSVCGDCLLLRHDEEGEAASVTDADIQQVMGKWTGRKAGTLPIV